ncbi:MAG: hypothetical protein ACYC2X_03035 [Coriobacteriia bacterium]
MGRVSSIAADRFPEEQLDLAALCADRQLSSSELFKPNDWYGMATVLKHYAGLPIDQQLKVLLPHGIYFNDHFVVGFERAAALPVVLGFEPQRLPLYAAGGVLAASLAAPFCFANCLVNHAEPRRGCLFVPMHSTHWLTMNTDWTAAADIAAGLHTEQEPVSVVIYWRDYLLGHHKPFTERGLRVVSAGHMFDPNFLLRQAWLLQSHARVVTNGLGSHVYYATHAGCPVHIIPQEYAIGVHESVASETPTLSPERAKAWRAVSEEFERTEGAITDAQRALAAHYLSSDHMLEPDELAELLLWAERLDCFGRAVLVIGARPESASGAIGHASVVPFRIRRWWQFVAERRLRRCVEVTIHIARTALPFLRHVRRPGWMK